MTTFCYHSVKQQQQQKHNTLNAVSAKNSTIAITNNFVQKQSGIIKGNFKNL